MSPVVLFTAMLVGPDINPPAQYWRDEFHSVMRTTSQRPGNSHDLAVPKLTSLYASIGSSDLSSKERERLQTSIESRLIKHLEELLRERKQQQKLSQSGGRSPGQLSGGGPVTIAQPLIDLIVTTIAPGSWKQQGGNATINYFPQSPALVIRQSQRAHEGIAELLQALR